MNYAAATPKHEIFLCAAVVEGRGLPTAGKGQHACRCDDLLCAYRACVVTDKRISRACIVWLACTTVLSLFAGVDIARSKMSIFEL